MNYSELQVGDWFEYNNSKFIVTELGCYCFEANEFLNFISGAFYTFQGDLEIKYLSKIILNQFVKNYIENLTLTNCNFALPVVGNLIHFSFKSKYLDGIGLVINETDIIILHSEDDSGFDLSGCILNLKNEDFFEAGKYYVSNLTCKEVFKIKL